MISSISSASSVYASLSTSSTSSSSKSSSLTSDQTDLISSVLSNYDSSNLTEEDAQAIVSAFEDAGITPSSELESAMEELGFSAQEVGQLAGVGPRGGGGGMPPPPSNDEVSSISSLLDSLLSTEEDEDGTSTTTTSFDDIMEYTSRILNLNEESKDEVMTLLEKYSSDDSEYSQDEKSSIIKNSLSQILSDTSNYKSVSFYG